MGRSTICCHQFALDCQRWEEVRFVATSLCSTVGRSTICPVCAERWEKVRFVATSLQCSVVKDGKKFDLLPPVCARLPKMGRSTIGCHQFVLKDGKKYDLLPAVCARVSKMGKSRVRGAVGVHVFQRFALRSRLMKHVIRTYVHNSNRLPLLACIRTQYVCSRCPCCFGRKLSVIVSLLRKLKHYCLVLSFGISDAMSDFRGAHIPGLGRELGGRDGALTFDEAIMHTTGQGLKLKGPETRPLSSIRDAGDVNVGDLPVRFLDSISGKVEQFCDAIQHVKIDVTADFFESQGVYDVQLQGLAGTFPSSSRTTSAVHYADSHPSCYASGRWRSQLQVCAHF